MAWLREVLQTTVITDENQPSSESRKKVLLADGV